MAAELEQLRVSLVAELVGREAFEQLKREVNQIKAATDGLDTTQRKYNKTIGETEKAIRGQRMATTQLGMQVSQISTQLSTGTSVATVFAQQIGDVGYALSGMGGILGRVGAFLSGPWGVALTVATMGVTALWSTFSDSEPASKGFESAMKRSEDAVFNYRLAVADTREEVIGLYQDQLALLEANWKKTVNETGRLRTNVADAKATFEDWTKQPGWKLFGAGKTLIFDQKKLAKATEDQANAFADMIEFQTAFENVKKGFRKQDQTASDRAMRDLEKRAKKEESLYQEFIGDNLKDAIKGLEDYSKAYSSTTSSNVKDAAAVFAAQLALQEQIKNYKFGEQMEAEFKVIDRIKSMSESMGEAFSSGIKGMITGAMNFKQVMGNVIDSVINKLFEMFVVQQIVGMISGALTSAFGPTSKASVSSSVNSLSSKAISGLSSIPGRAIGGPVQAGGAYMVGERGPELFVPSRSGSIVPNGGNGGMVVNVDARGAADPAAVRAQVEMGIAQAAPYIIAAAQNKTLKTAARPRLPGTIG